MTSKNKATRVKPTKPRVITRSEVELITMMEHHVRSNVPYETWCQLQKVIGEYGRGEFNRGYLAGAEDMR